PFAQALYVARAHLLLLTREEISVDRFIHTVADRGNFDPSPPVEWVPHKLRAEPRGADQCCIVPLGLQLAREIEKIEPVGVGDEAVPKRNLAIVQCDQASHVL